MHSIPLVSTQFTFECDLPFNTKIFANLQFIATNKIINYYN